MKTTKLFLAGAAAIGMFAARGELTPMDWTEGNLVVPAGSEVTVSGAEKWNTGLQLHGTMNVNMDAAGTKYYVHAGTHASPVGVSIVLGGDPGDTAHLNILKGAMWGRYGNNMYSVLYFGKNDDDESGSSHLTIGPYEGWSALDEEFNQVHFRAGLKPLNPDDPVIDAITLDRNAQLFAFSYKQYNAKPVRITFTNSLPNVANGFRPILRGFYSGNMFYLNKAGGDIILRGNGYYSNGVTSAPILLGGHGSVTATVFERLFSTSASERKACLRTEGDCDFVFDVGNNDSDTPYWQELNATNVIWGHTGDFLIPNANDSKQHSGLRTTVSRALPHGPQTGIVRVESDANYALKHFIDLYGTTQSINGLKLTGGSRIRNLASTPAELVFGEGGTSGTISAGTGIDATVSCRKIGSGKLTLVSTSLSSLTVEAGTLEISGSCHVDQLVYTGRVAVVNGGTLTIGDRSRCAIECYDVMVGTQPKVEPFGYQASITPFLEETRKGGEGLMSITMDRLPQGPLAVAEGTLRVVPPACNDEYWRFVFKKSSGTVNQYGSSSPYRQADGAKPAVLYLVLGKLHLLGANGAIVNLGTTYKNTAAATSLTAGSHSFTHEFFNTRNVQYGAGAEWNSGGYVSLDMGSWWSATAFTNQALVANNPATWETITFRLKSGVRGVAGYMLSEGSNANYPYADPRTWTLESSADAASVAAGTWTVRDARTDFSLPHYGTGNKDYFCGNKPFALNQMPVGGLVFTNAVSVAAGATLELAVPGTSVAAAGLTVDLTAGAGTISGFAAGANGVLALRNPTGTHQVGGHLKSKIVLPLTLTDVGSTAGLSSWSVTVDGVPSPASSVAFENGKIVVQTSVGTCMLIR